MDAYERIEKATAECSDAVRGVKSDQMGDATPCSEFDVAGLLRHVLGGMTMLKTAATGGKAEVPSDDPLAAGEPAEVYEASRAELLGVLKDPAVFDKTWSMPFGEMPGKMMAGIAFMEHLTHAWDIRKATGQPTDLPEDLVKECLELVKPMDAMLRMPGVCGPAVEVGADASLTDQLVGYMGRQP
jgi:uncharacterized protein (TIGR03086 family)